jgi:hypothetical protein
MSQSATREKTPLPPCLGVPVGAYLPPPNTVAAPPNAGVAVVLVAAGAGAVVAPKTGAELLPKAGVVVLCTWGQGRRWVPLAHKKQCRLISRTEPPPPPSTNPSPTLPSFPLPNPILYLGIPCALVKLME